MPDDPQPPARGALRAWIAASSLLGVVVIGIGAGLWLDRHYGTSPRWLAGLGLGAVVVAMVRLVKEAGK